MLNGNHYLVSDMRPNCTLPWDRGQPLRGVRHETQLYSPVRQRPTITWCQTWDPTVLSRETEANNYVAFNMRPNCAVPWDRGTLHGRQHVNCQNFHLDRVSVFRSYWFTRRAAIANMAVSIKWVWHCRYKVCVSPYSNTTQLN